MKQPGSKYSERELYVTEMLDNVFWSFDQLEHYIQINLIRFQDIAHPVAWCVNRMQAKDIYPAIILYCTEGYGYVEPFCLRFVGWTESSKDAV